MSVPEVTPYDTPGVETTGILRALVNANAGFALASGAIAAITDGIHNPSINVSFGSLPSPTIGNLTALRPTKPGDTTLILPQIPTAETLIAIDYGEIPSFPEVTFSQMAIPDIVISTAVERYASTLLNEIKSKLMDRILYGGTGLSPEVEQAIIDRDRERALLSLADSKTRLADEWSKKGWPLPNGILLEVIDNAETEFVNKRLEVSRDIVKIQADLEQLNIKESIQQAIQLEAQLMAYHSQFCELLFRSVEALQKAKIEIYNTWNNFYRTYVESIRDYAQAMTAEATLKTEINRVKLLKYTSELEMFKSEITAEVERVSAILKVYQEDISAYSAESQAFQAISGAEVKLYEAKGNLAIGEAQVSVSASSASIQAMIQNAQTAIHAAVGRASAAATLAAGAMSAAHTSISLSSAYQASVHRQGSESVTHYFSE